MGEWVGAVTHPLGLAGFALFLAFSYLAVRFRSSKAPWIPVFLAGLAAIVVVGGLYLGGRKQDDKDQGPSANQGPTTNQNSAGSNSPNFSGVGGNVTFENNVSGNGNTQ